MLGWNESAWYSLFVITALKSIVALGAAWLAANLLRGRSAAARHLVWTTAAAALLALPFLSISLPALRVSLAGAPSVVFQTTTSASVEAPASRAQPRAELPAPKSRPWLPDWRLALMLLWAGGAAAALAQMLTAAVVIWRLRRQTSPFNDLELPGLTLVLGIQHDVDIRATRRGSMPMTFGLIRPVVFMPADASEWSRERRRVVLLHELAHVRRGDIATHLLARTALSVYWWNPLAWIAWREFLKERERATDDLVLSAGAGASEYAGHLLEIARTMQSPSAIGWAAVAMARQSQLEGRLQAILDSSRVRKPPGRASALATALLAVSVVAPLAALRAQDNQALPADVDATILTAIAQRDYKMLDRAANAAERLQKYDMAQKLLESSLAIRGKASGQQSVEYSVGLMRLGDLDHNRGKIGEAEGFYTKAVSMLGNRPEAALALFHLGTIAVMKKDLGEAIRYFERSQVADPSRAGPAIMWMAVVRQAQKDTEEAESLYQRALAIEESNSAEAATTMELYAQFLRQQGREQEGTSLRDRAAAIWKARGAQTMPIRPDASSNVFREGKESVREEQVLLSEILISTDGKTADEVAQAEKQAKDLVARARQGEQFGEMARQYSNAETKDNLGKLPPYRRGQLKKDIEDVVFKEKKGYVTDPIRLPNGFDILKVEEHSNAGPAPLANAGSVESGTPSNGVTAPVVLSKVDPEYTEEARFAKYEGTVVVSAEIRPDGLAYNIRAIRGLGLGLDEKAIQAISQWKFKPGSKNGQPVPVIATIEVNFHLL
jgi:TonB family protein